MNKLNPSSLLFILYVHLNVFQIIKDLIELRQLFCDGFELHHPKGIEFLFQKSPNDSNLPT